MKSKVIIFAVAALGFASCNSETQEQKQLRQLVEERNKDICPKEISFGIMLDSITYNDNQVSYHTTVEGGLADFKVLREEEDKVKDIIYNVVIQGDSPEIKQEIDLCHQAGSKIVFVFTNSGGDTYALTIDPAEYADK